jgi:hypothetical protein
MALTDLLVWLSGGGCVIAASWLLERFPKYVALPDNIKELIFFLVAAFFGTGAYAASVYVPVAILSAIGPYFLILSAIFSYVFVGGAFHALDKKN